MIFVRKAEGKRPCGRSMHRWEGIIELALKKTECKGVDWIHLAQDRVKCW
jgi:hypothetical protein